MGQDLEQVLTRFFIEWTPKSERSESSDCSVNNVDCETAAKVAITEITPFFSKIPVAASCLVRSQ